MQDAEVQGTLRSPRSVPRHLGQRSVPAFESGKRKSYRAVLMFKQPGQLRRCVRFLESLFQNRLRSIRL